jgi:hypothetical protein
VGPIVAGQRAQPLERHEGNVGNERVNGLARKRGDTKAPFGRNIAALLGSSPGSQSLGKGGLHDAMLASRHYLGDCAAVDPFRLGLGSGEDDFVGECLHVALLTSRRAAAHHAGPNSHGVNVAPIERREERDFG